MKPRLPVWWLVAASASSRFARADDDPGYAFARDCFRQTRIDEHMDIEALRPSRAGAPLDDAALAAHRAEVIDLDRTCACEDWASSPPRLTVRICAPRQALEPHKSVARAAAAPGIDLSR